MASKNYTCHYEFFVCTFRLQRQNRADSSHSRVSALRAAPSLAGLSLKMKKSRSFANHSGQQLTFRRESFMGVRSNQSSNRADFQHFGIGTSCSIIRQRIMSFPCVRLEPELERSRFFAFWNLLFELHHLPALPSKITNLFSIVTTKKYMLLWVFRSYYSKQSLDGADSLHLKISSSCSTIWCTSRKNEWKLMSAKATATTIALRAIVWTKKKER